MESLNHYFQRDYLKKERFQSYLDQMEIVKRYVQQHDHILEIGIGNGYMTNLLRSFFGLHVTTIDIVPELSPDMIVDISKENLNLNQKFDVAICFEVLEHIEWRLLPQTISNILNHTKGFFIFSVPNINHFIQFNYRKFLFGYSSKSIIFEIPRLRKIRQPLGKSHCWEIGVNRDKDVIDAKKVIRELIGMERIIESFRGRELPAHHFFVVKGQADND